MFNWLKKRVLKSIVKDIVKKLPIYKDKALDFVEEHIDEILQKIKDAIINIIETEFKKHLDSKEK